jgi:hypothetical protein
MTMTRLTTVRAACLSALSLLALATTLPGHAESFASSASSAGSASSGSVSDSIKGSSNSSKRDKEVAEGPYRVIDVAEVAEAAGRPAMMQLTLRATEAGAEREFILELPRQALAARPLGTGDLVQANQRPYGFEFARVDTREAFFLVLTDDWRRDLDSRVVTL